MKSDRGSATMVALIIIPALSASAFFMLALAQQALVRQELRTAADLAALAAAQALGANCERAADISHAHGVTLESCAPDGADWTIHVSLPPAPLMQRFAAMLGQELSDQVQHATAGYSAITGAPSSST